ncbi:hypothetical protein CYMTET_23528, partial [Cymbomonas tetramitiformis]
SRPLLATAPEIVDRSIVWEVRFDAMNRFSQFLGADPRSDVPNVLACWESGKLAVVRMGPGLPNGSMELSPQGSDREAQLVLLEENSAVNTFDVDSATGQEIICGAESGCLGYVRESDLRDPNEMVR